MKLGRNLLAGLANSVWSAVVGLAIVPFYLKYLGVEAYGLIGFFTSLQAILSLLDMGMAPTVNREVARCSAAGNVSEAGGLLHTLAVIYWGMAALIAALIVLLAPWIAGHWLQSRQLEQQTVTHAVMMMGVVVASRWPVGLYQGALVGAQRLVLSSSINMSMVTVGGLGAIVILSQLSPTIEAFFAWQACVGLVYAITMRVAAWRIVGKQTGQRFDADALKRVWRFTAGMSGIAVTGLVFTQLDKVILSKILRLEEFGHYMLATVVVSGLYMLVIPAFNAIYPRMSGLVVESSETKLAELYHVGTRALASVLFPLAMFVIVFAEALVSVWTRDPHVATVVAPIISILAAGSALHGVMHFPYALQLAYGQTNLPLKINIILMIVQLPLMAFLAIRYGAIGGALAWLILHSMYLLLGSWLTHRKLLQGQGGGWLLREVCTPLLCAVSFGLVAYQLSLGNGYSVWWQLLGGAALALVAMIVSMLTAPRLSAVFFGSLGGVLRK